jgi:hypothetical protein
MYGLPILQVSNYYQHFKDLGIFLKQIHNIHRISNAVVEIVVSADYSGEFKRIVTNYQPVLRLHETFDPRTVVKHLQTPERQLEASQKFATRAFNLMLHRNNSTVRNFFASWVNESAPAVRKHIEKLQDDSAAAAASAAAKASTHTNVAQAPTVLTTTNADLTTNAPPTQVADSVSKSATSQAPDTTYMSDSDPAPSDASTAMAPGNGSHIDSDDEMMHTIPASPPAQTPPPTMTKRPRPSSPTPPPSTSSDHLIYQDDESS